MQLASSIPILLAHLLPPLKRWLNRAEPVPIRAPSSAGEYCKEVVEEALRIHGGYGYSQEYEIERLYRAAPLLLIGEGTAEIQKTIIGRRLLDQFKIALPGPQVGPRPAVITGG
jgi:acyl-CoA dehydrogenase-like protein